MWNNLVGLLDIGFKTDADYEYHLDNLAELNGWIKREYPLLTCEEVVIAYNKAVKHQLSTLEKLFPVLAPRYIGDVLTAYEEFTQQHPEVNRVFAQQLLSDMKSPEPTEQEIDTLMNQALNQAIGEVEMGGRYGDTGNGLYRWLYKKGVLVPSDDVWAEYLDTAQFNVRQSLVDQKKAFNRHDMTVGDHSKRNAIEQKLSDLMRGHFTAEYKQLVRSEAMRLCLHDYLLTLAGPIQSRLQATPDAPSEFTPFSHEDYIKGLPEQLKHMSDEAVSDLQQSARKANQLDVYEIVTIEWNQRTNTTSQAVAV